MLDLERNWRGAGVVFAVLIIIASLVYGSAPKAGSGSDQLVAFFNGDRGRILVAAIIFSFGFLALLWFGAALSSVLRDAGQGGWGAAATASSAVLGAMLFLLIALRAALAFSIADSGHPEFTTGLHQLSWALTVIASFPAAMFVMAGAFGLWRAGLISSRFFSVGVLAVVLVLLGGTTWATNGVWAPDGGYALASRLVLVAWIAVISGLLYMQGLSAVKTPDRAAVPTA
jgi:hypothetical protein